MAKADIDQVALREAIAAATQGLQDDIAQIKRQLAVINWEDNHWLDQARSAAGQTITKLPTDQENPVIWGLAGAYRLGAKVNQRRLSFWSFDDIDEYLDCAQDADIARFASLFTDPAAVGVIQQLVKGPQQVADLATLCAIDREALDGVPGGPDRSRPSAARQRRSDRTREGQRAFLDDLGRLDRAVSSADRRAREALRFRSLLSQRWK